MKKLIVVASILGLLLPAAETTPAPACAAEPNYAAVTIRFGPGNEQTYCVSFTEDSISGMSALKRTGLRVVTKPYGGMGEFVCKIGSVGTEADDCPAGDNSHWRYFHGGRGSSSGASGTKVTCGTVEGWSWYAGGTGSPPSSTSFSSICSGRSCPQQAGSGSQAPPQQPGTSSGGQSGAGDTGGSSPATRAAREAQPRAAAPTASPADGTLAPEAVPPSQADESRASTILPEEDVPLAVARVERPPPAAGERPAGRERTAVIVFAASLAVVLGLFAQTLLRRP